MVFKWATFTYRRILLPSFYGHHRYWLVKTALDRQLERQTGWSNFLLGCILGGVLYLILSPFRPLPVSKSIFELKDDANETLAILGIDLKQEFPVIALRNLKYRVVSRALVANDEAEIRKHQILVETLKELEQSKPGAVSEAARAGLAPSKT